MGHNTLSRIPGYKYWRNVVETLDGPSPNQDVISASAKAAEREMLRAADDPVFVEAVRLLLVIPKVARSDAFGAGLRELDIDIRDRPELIDLVVATTERLDAVARQAPSRTDFGELAARALATTLTRTIGASLPGLFEATPEDVQSVARDYSFSRGISELSRRFFGALVAETLSYWLDRTLDTHVGEGRRFRNVGERSAFDVELEQYTTEATRIIQEFSGGWYGKHLHQKGAFGTEDAAAFGAVALKKIVEELRRKQSRDD